MAEKPRSLDIRILADKSGGQGPPWPRLGVVIQNEGGPPKRVVAPRSFIQAGKSEGWITVEGSRAIMKPGGPPEDPWRVDPAKGIPHVFEQIDAFTIHTMTGPVRYEVAGQPDKYDDAGKPSEGEHDAGNPDAAVSWAYEGVLTNG